MGRRKEDLDSLIKFLEDQKRNAKFNCDRCSIG